jgi:putative sterol carrier protein
VPRPPTSVVRVSAETLLALLAGELDLSRAQLTGKLRIDGDPAAGFLVGGMVSMFRAGGDAPGPSGLVVRRLARWFKEAPPP